MRYRLSRHGELDLGIRVTRGSVEFFPTSRSSTARLVHSGNPQNTSLALSRCPVYSHSQFLHADDRSALPCIRVLLKGWETFAFSPRDSFYANVDLGQ